MATLYKRGDIYWAQFFSHGKRRRISLETDNHGVAKAKIRKMDHDLATGGLQLPIPSRKSSSATPNISTATAAPKAFSRIFTASPNSSDPSARH